VLTYNGQEQQLVNITNTSASGINNSTGYKVLPLGVTRIANTNKIYFFFIHSPLSSQFSDFSIDMRLFILYYIILVYNCKYFSD